VHFIKASLSRGQYNRAVLIKACINGARRPDAHPALPTTPITLGWAAAAALRAGAGAIHFHVRGPDLAQSLDADAVARCLLAVRGAVGGAPVGISTLLSIVQDPDRRLTSASKWSVLPDFVSVNFNEAGSPALAKLLIEKGVGIEAGLFDAAAAEALVKSGLAGRCLRILLEPRGADVNAAVASANEMVAVLREKTELERLRIAWGMWRSAREMLINLIKAEHPDWSIDEVRRNAARRLAGGSR
jgi:uncharacterized protein (DUF849 family)